MNERCKYHVCDEEDDHSPECADWQQEHRNLDGEDAPYPGMATAFEAHYGQRWTDPDWRKEAATWAAAWKAALSHNAGNNCAGMLAAAEIAKKFEPDERDGVYFPSDAIREAAKK